MIKPDIECNDTCCCLNCFYHREKDGHWCIYQMDDDGNDVWEEIRGPEEHKCIDWEER